jgi:hypothetical protein
MSESQQSVCVTASWSYGASLMRLAAALLPPSSPPCPPPPPPQAPAGKRYFRAARLADILCHYPLKPGLSEEEEAGERRAREALLDLLLGVLDPDPRTR